MVIAVPISWRALVALATFEALLQCGATPLDGGCPRSIRPRRVVSHVLVVTALKFGDPIVLSVKVKAGDQLQHGNATPRVASQACDDGRTPGPGWKRIYRLPQTGSGSPPVASCLSDVAQGHDEEKRGGNPGIAQWAVERG